VIFPSYIFLIVFLPTALALWYGLRSLSARVLFLTAASYVFYGWWDYRFCALMFGTTFLDFICGLKIYRNEDERWRRRWLAVALIGNLTVLGFFKYYDFFVTAVADGLSAMGLQVAPPILNLVLPIGISFYTFHSLSYSFDIFRRHCAPTNSFAVFSAYVTMFPHLVAGPIVRYESIEEQLRALPFKRVDFAQLSDGVWLFVIGLVKKIWIADALAPIASAVFDGGQTPALVTSWLGVLCYTFQLYFDFSAYSDMALGLAKMLGFDFPRNFDSPYKATDISAFWRRWHITLSGWLRDYLFIPLGGSRGSRAKTLRNLGITMFLGGLWHGAGWTFVVWGLYHGLLLMVHSVWSQVSPWRLPRVAAVAVTFLTVVVGWVFFRAPTFEHASGILQGMAGFNGVDQLVYRANWNIAIPEPLSDFPMRWVVVLALASAVSFLAPNSMELPKPRHPAFGAALALVVLVTMCQFGQAIPFLYYQF
jgi:alginate O-acetyltransferase complex protein AlgI